MKDIKNFDYLSVSVKTDNEEEMIERYVKFGWEVIERFDDKQYSDLAVLDFKRPHVIPHKDRLQYLQVCMETVVNDLSKNKQNKHATSLSLGLSLGLLGGALIAGGVVLVVLLTVLWLMLVGSFMIAVGIGLFAVMAIVFKRLVPKEKARFEKITEEAQKKLSFIDQEAATLVKRNHGT